MRLPLLLLFFIAPLVTIEVAASPVQAESGPQTCDTIARRNPGPDCEL